MSGTKAELLSNAILEEAFGDDLEGRAIPWTMIIELIMDMIGGCGASSAAQRAVQPTWRDRVRLGRELRRDGFGWRDRRKITNAAFKVAAEAGVDEVEKAMKEIEDID